MSGCTCCVDHNECCDYCQLPKDVKRVLEAARAISKRMTGPTAWPEVVELRAAIDALDASRERFVVSDEQKWFGEICEQRVVDTNDGAETIVVRGRCGMAYRVKDALNAAEAKP